MRRLLPALFLLLGVSASQEPAARPNILWITCEDISPNVRCFGDEYAVTPNIDRFTAQGVKYTRAFAPIGVCAPSRSTLILGTFACSAGTQHMRCNGPRPEYLRCFPEYLREAGYYCSNNEKTDYNFPAPKAAWDESSRKAHWRGRKPGQPFFSVFNILTSHESQIRIPEAQYQKRTAGFTAAERHDPAQAPLPPYHPDTPEVRKDWARYADMITLMDKEVGQYLKELEDDGLAGDTLVFYFSDHGAGMPRSKRWLYDSSLLVPMAIRFPEKWKSLAPSGAGTSTDRLISFVDYGPTVLSLVGAKIPEHMQGKPFLGARAAEAREYIHGFRDRMDERYDLLRCVRDRRWKYIRNYRPDRIWSQYIGYMYEMPTMAAWQKLHDEGRLNEVQDRFFRTKPAEELYDTDADPWEIRSLAEAPEHRETLERLRNELRRWLLEIRDLGFLPEAELRTRFGATAPHEAVRREPKSYPLERILDAAELASRGDLKCGQLFDDADSAVRYWGAIGCLVLRDKAAPLEERLRKALADPSPSVRVAAAQALAGLGQVDLALPALGKVLRENDEWAKVQALNVVDDLGPRAAPLRDAVEALKPDKGEYVKRLVERILSR
ncbi:MAG TPA: sulfatase [Planctomycetota bacterium]|nr:sulfatase [Planctomycetota bacterium]